MEEYTLWWVHFIPLAQARSYQTILSNRLAVTHKFAKTSAMVSVLTAGLGWEENERLKGLMAQEQI